MKILRNLFAGGAMLLCLVAPAVVLGGQASAVDIFSHCGTDSVKGTPDVCTDANNSNQPGAPNPILKVIRIAISIVSFVTGIASVVGILFASMRFITSNGDSNAISSARSGLMYSLIGLAITVVAESLVVFVLDKLT